MKPKLYFTLILPLVVFCFVGCHKDRKPPTYYLPQEVKDYMYFKPSTYWVYKDSVSGALDSVIVKDATTEMYTWADGPKEKDISHYDEIFTVKTFSYYENLEYVYRGTILGASDWYPPEQLHVCYKILR